MDEHLLRDFFSKIWSCGYVTESWHDQNIGVADYAFKHKYVDYTPSKWGQIVDDEVRYYYDITDEGLNWLYANGGPTALPGETPVVVEPPPCPAEEAW